MTAPDQVDNKTVINLTKSEQSVSLVAILGLKRGAQGVWTRT
jgi:hypothetical protein